jgi:hypothetical protein
MGAGRAGGHVPSVFVQEFVMEGAHEGEIVQIGRAPETPVADVMCVQEVLGLAAGERAPAVAIFQLP